MKTILIVEDNDAIRENIAEMLELANYQVLTAANGKEGIDTAKKHMPDLIVTDVMMPVVDGFGMLHMLRRDPITETIPVIFLTSKNERTDLRNAMDSGADDFITKPFNNDELLKAIENRFNRHDTLKKKMSAELQNLNELMAAANNDTLETLPANRETTEFRKKQVIYKEGYAPHYLYYIQKGKVKTYKTHEDGKQLVLGLYHNGDFLGYTALLEECPYKETAEAMDETELVLIPRKDFENLVQKNVQVANKLVKMLAKNISENERHLLGIAYNTLRKKVAGALLSMQKKYQADKTQTFYIDISREDMAAIAGTAKESFIRTLAEFKDEKLIRVGKDNRIEIINSPKLEHLLR